MYDCKHEHDHTSRNTTTSRGNSDGDSGPPKCHHSHETEITKDDMDVVVDDVVDKEAMASFYARAPRHTSLELYSETLLPSSSSSSTPLALSSPSFTLDEIDIESPALPIFPGANTTVGVLPGPGDVVVDYLSVDSLFAPLAEYSFISRYRDDVVEWTKSKPDGGLTIWSPPHQTHETSSTDETTLSSLDSCQLYTSSIASDYNDNSNNNNSHEEFHARSDVIRAFEKRVESLLKEFEMTLGCVA